MNITVDMDVLNNRRWAPIIEIIIELAAAARHDLSECSISALRDANWFKDEPRDLVDLLDQVEKKQGLRATSSARVIIKSAVEDCGYIGSENETVVSPSKALEFLLTPFQIIVENEEFDGSFLLWMARALKRSDFSLAYRSGRLEFRHAGGKGSINRSIRLLSSRVWGRPDRRYSREMSRWAGVIIDSDSKYPGHAPNQAIISGFGGRVAFTHILNKRAIESYLPKIVMLKHLPASTRPKIEAFFGLTAEQRRHFHMKNGIRLDGELVTKKEFRTNSRFHVAERTLFSSIEDANWSLVTSGFGASLSEIYVNESSRPDAGGCAELIDADDAAELNELFSKIMEVC